VNKRHNFETCRNPMPLDNFARLVEHWPRGIYRNEFRFGAPYSIDAPEVMPAGSHFSIGPFDTSFTASTISRRD